MSREEQDRYALSSQLKALYAVEVGVFSGEIIPVKISDEDVLSEDEAVRGNSTLEKLGTLRTVFSEEGTVTAGNASPLNDGASVVILASKNTQKIIICTYLATIKEVAEVGIDPSIIGIAQSKAIQN